MFIQLKASVHLDPKLKVGFYILQESCLRQDGYSTVDEGEAAGQAST